MPGGHSDVHPVNVFLLRALRIVIGRRRQSRAAGALRELDAGATIGAGRLPAPPPRCAAAPGCLPCVVSGYGLAYFLRISPPSAPRSILAVAKHANARRQVDRVCGLGRAGALSSGSDRVRDWRDVGGTLAARLRGIGASPAGARFASSARSTASMGFSWRVNRWPRSRGTRARRRCSASTALARSRLQRLESRGVGFIGRGAALGFRRSSSLTPIRRPFRRRWTSACRSSKAKRPCRPAGRKGPITGNVLLAGVEGDSAPLDASRSERTEPGHWDLPARRRSPGRRWPRSSTTAVALRRPPIVIRWHPSMLDGPALDSLSTDRESSRIPDRRVRRRWHDRCDWVIADENSNVHLPVLKLGFRQSQSGIWGPIRRVAPTCMDSSPRHRLSAGASIRDRSGGRSKAFFSDGWAARFKQYDASYLRPHAEFRTKFAARYGG